MQKKTWILNTLPNGVIRYNMPLSTINILIVSVSIPYRSPIVLLSFSYRSPIVLLLFSYCSPIVLLLGKRKQYGNNTESNGGWTENERRMNEWGTVEQGWLILLLSKFLRQWQDSNQLLWGSKCHLSTTTKFDKLMQKKYYGFWIPYPLGKTSQFFEETCAINI